MSFFQRVRSAFGFAHNELPDRPSTEEIATRRVHQLASLMEWLPNPDKILRKTGNGIEHMRSLTYDDEVFTSIEYLFGALRDIPFELKHDETNEVGAEVVKAALKGLDWERIDAEIIDARLYGYQPFEIDWAEQDGFWIPVALTGKPPEWFGFDQENHLGLRKQRRADTFTTVPEGKFLCPRHRPSFKNPYGESALSRCFWPVTFKKGDLRFWITFAEKYGMPHAVGKHPRGASDDEVNQLLDQLAAMVQDAVAAVPDDSSVELLESPFKASSSGVYKAIIDWAERTIQKVLLSSEMVTSAGEYGTQALGAEQIEEVAGSVVGGLVRKKMSVAEGLIDLMWHFNFRGQDGKPTYEPKDEPDASKEKAERDTQLNRQGVRFTPTYYQREYGLQEDDFEIVSPQEPSGPAGPGGFAHDRTASQFNQFNDLPDGGQSDVDALIETLAGRDEENQRLMEDVLEAPMRLVMEGERAEDVMEALARAYPDMDATALEERLRSLFFAAEMWGRLTDEEEATD